MNDIKTLLLQNKAWAENNVANDPEYFKRMSIDQTPKYLWIGCSDSRVPPSEITNTDPGEIFVARNIANMVIHTDLNLLSVLQYAVEVLRVKHIIVCGHYNCGGVKAALQRQSLGLIDNWIRNIKDVVFEHKKEIDSISSEQEKFDRMVEFNVENQIKNLIKTTIIQKSWETTEGPIIHGWVYDLKTGLIKVLSETGPNNLINDIYHYEFKV